MSTWVSTATDLLWQNALALVPFSLIVAGLCRWVPCRPATRHFLWLCVLAWLPVGLLLPRLSFSPADHPSSPMPAASFLPDQRPDKGERMQRRSARVTPPSEESRHADRPARQAIDVWQVPPQDLWQNTPEDPWQGPSQDLWHRFPTGAKNKFANAGQDTNIQSPHAEPDAVADTDPIADAISVTPPLMEPSPPTTGMVAPLPRRPIAATATQPAPPFWRASLGRWLAGLVAVRDAVGRLPTFPSALWLAGIGVVLAVRSWQALRFAGRVRAGAPAPTPVTAQVRQIAAALGLRRVPKTIMVHSRISPMIWCWGRPRLILPRDLWSQFDCTGRRAVLYHELAHLRRRDHWVCWVEALVGAIYWWHPLIWWVRGKLHDEAEKCCDAWVTWLLPNGRRAYVEALLATRQFVGQTTSVATATGLAMATGKTKHFSRRLTMVMTQRQAPKLSTSGMALALSLAIAAWAATPATSAEPANRPGPGSTGSVSQVPPAAPVTPFATFDPAAPIPYVAPVPPAPPIGSMAWAVAPKPPRGPGADRGHGDLERRLERLERQLERLAERLERIAHPARRPGEPPASKAQRRRGRPHGRGAGAPGFTEAPAPRREIVRTYHLPRGQLEALAKLMIRSDVPIRVRPTDDGIEVHATAEQHARFRAFVEMLSGKDSVVAYRLSKGKLKALTELMGRDDVPIMVEPADDAIKVHGSPAVQAVFRGFVEMINPSKGGTVGSAERLPLRSLSPAEARRLIREWGGRSAAESPRPSIRRSESREALRDLTQEQLLRELSEEIAERQGAVARRVRELQSTVENQIASRILTTRVQAESRQAIKELSHHAKQLEKQAEQLEELADRLEDRADRLRLKADDLRERSKESDKPEKAGRLKIEADEVEAQADALESQMERLLARAESLQDQAEAVEAQADEMRERIEAQLERQIEKAGESAEDHRDVDEDDDRDDDDE